MSQYVCPFCLDPECGQPWNVFCQYEIPHTSMMDEGGPPAHAREQMRQSREKHSNPPPMNPAPGK